MQKKQKLIILIFCAAFFAVSAVLAIIFYQERTFLDAIFYLFHLINSKSFVVEHQRYVHMFSQALPLLAVWLGVSLKYVMMIYSLSQVIYFFLIFYFSYRLAGIYHALPVLIISVCGAWWLYYVPFQEAWFGPVSCILFHAMLISGYHKKSWLHLMMFGVWIFVCISGHPLTFSVILLLVLITVPLAEWKKDGRLLASLAVAFVAWVLLKKFFITDYEAANMARRQSGIAEGIRAVFHPAYLLAVLKALGRHYFFTGILVLISALIFFQEGALYKLLLFLGWLAGFVFLVNFMQDAHAAQMRPDLERMYIMPTTGVAIVFCGMLERLSVKTQKSLLIFLGISIPFLFWYQLQHRFFYSKRIEAINRLIDEHINDPNPKLCVDFASRPDFEQLDEWSTTMETIFYSTLKGRTITVSDCSLLNSGANRFINHATHIHLRFEEWIRTDELNTTYFTLPPTEYKPHK